MSTKQTPGTPASPRTPGTETAEFPPGASPASSKDSDYSELEELSRRGRWHVLQTVSASGAGHVGGPMSAMDLLIALFFRVMAVFVEGTARPRPGRFYFSQGGRWGRRFSPLARLPHFRAQKKNKLH